MHLSEAMAADIKQFVDRHSDKYPSVMSVVEAGARLKILEHACTLKEG